MDSPTGENPLNVLLSETQRELTAGLDVPRLARILQLVGCPVPDKRIIRDIRIYSDYLPKAAEQPFTYEQRYLHFLWEVFDQSPLSRVVNFAFPFRRQIAKNLFLKCGKNFISEGNVRFNFGQLLSIGDNVFFNSGVFIDSKGGVSLGNSVALAENVRIFTHSHSESDHTHRDYASVTIGDYAKIYGGATILPGVTVGKEAIVAVGAVVTHDIPSGMVAAGVPAKIIRERQSDGRTGKDLNHLWFHEGAFQDE